ncbi:MAG: beta-galactosidase [Chitinophagaceae bacterium]|nr:beta-galactosidase [Chitinophagaceae bacterium]
MKYFFSLLCSFAFATVVFSQTSWQPVPGKIATEWATQVDPANPLPEYPRPQLTRKSWMNLNGLWQYTIIPRGSATAAPAQFDGNILVPFAVESSLSGVGKTVGKENELWYKRTVKIPSAFRKGRVFLHFGAVDWECVVYINGKEVGAHQGGYDPFSFDISEALDKGVQQEIAVRVWDPSNDGPQPRGKQVKEPRGIWYTSVTGIWQTVWLENVPNTFIASTRQTPDIDNQTLTVEVKVENLQLGDEIEVSAWDGQQKVAAQTLREEKKAVLSIDNPRLWSPSDPFLYDLKISILRKRKVIDEVGSYFGMRKSSLAKGTDGITRMMLNNEFVFQYGPLDQGWWPDGLYTAPTDEALKFDIEKTKEMGFNMIRKHVKVEPARWYYYCDKLGMLVWQDMPSGDLGGNGWDQRPGEISGRELDKDRSAESEAIYRKEWKAILDAHYNYPSIVSWVPFNEAWGQFKTKEIVKWTMEMDPTRLVNEASGGNFFYTGHILDIHHYPNPEMPDPRIFGDKPQALVLGEFGGLGLPLEGHTWQDSKNWGYQSFQNKDELFDKYAEFMKQLRDFIDRGLSAAVYTQTTDVEIETNGLLTYDRKVLKMPLEKLREVHKPLYE